MLSRPSHTPKHREHHGIDVELCMSIVITEYPIPVRALEIRRSKMIHPCWINDNCNKICQCEDPERLVQRRNPKRITLSYEQINESGKTLNRIVRAVSRVNYNRLLLDCPVGNSTVMYDVSKMGKFEVPNIRKRNDDALWLKMLRVEPYIWGIPNVLVKYRIRPNSISVNKFSLVKYHWHLYRKIEQLNLLRSVFHVFFWCFLKIFRIK